MHDTCLQALQLQFNDQSSVLPATVQVTTVHRTQVYNLGGLGGLAPELMNSSDGMFGASVMHGWCALASVWRTHTDDSPCSAGAAVWQVARTDSSCHQHLGKSLPCSAC